MTARSLIRILSYCLLVLAGVFLINTIINDWTHLQSYRLSFKIMPLSISILIWAIVYIMYSQTWRRVLMILDPSVIITPITAIRVYILTEFYKYIPGTIWPIAGRAYFAPNDNKARVMVASTLDVILSLMGILIIGSWALVWRFSISVPILFITTCLLVLLLSSPQIFYRLINQALYYIGRQPVPVSSWLESRVLIDLFIRYLLIAFVMGGAFVLFLSSITTIPLSFVFPIVTTFCLSVGLGIATPLLPSGLGVREGLLVAGLSLYMPSELALVAALSARIWSTAGEALLLAAATGVGLIRHA